MKEQHGEGLASHTGPESCADACESVGEALTGVRTGQPLSCEINLSGVPTSFTQMEGHIVHGATRESCTDPAQSETLSMCGNSLHGNRETPRTPTGKRPEGRSEKGYARASDVHVRGESDGSIVPKKQANKAGASAAEPVEGRGPTKGNDLPVGHAPDSERGARGHTQLL